MEEKQITRTFLHNFTLDTVGRYVSNTNRYLFYYIHTSIIQNVFITPTNIYMAPDSH